MLRTSAMRIYAENVTQHTSLSFEDAMTFTELLWPDVELISEEDGLYTYMVTASSLASTFGGILSGDLNADEHTGHAGFTQTVVIIGMCAAVACAYDNGYALAKIAPDVSFSKPLPLGSPAIMTVREQKRRGKLVWLDLNGLLPDTREPFFKPRVLTMSSLT